MPNPLILEGFSRHPAINEQWLCKFLCSNCIFDALKQILIPYSVDVAKDSCCKGDEYY